MKLLEREQDTIGLMYAEYCPVQQQGEVEIWGEASISFPNLPSLSNLRYGAVEGTTSPWTEESQV